MNWILDADIEGFFDTIDHEWLIKFLEHRIGDRRILRLIRKWLRAGVSEEGEWSKTTVGAPQGSVISPLLSNVFLHYVFDLWIEWWRNNRCRGDVIVVRYADDFVIGFEHHSEATACLEELHARFAKFGLKLHEGKDASDRVRSLCDRASSATRRGPAGNFRLSGVHAQVCPDTKTWLGSLSIVIPWPNVCVRPCRRSKLKLRKRMHWSLGETARWLRSVVQGWLNYHAVPFNSIRIRRFVNEVTRQWLRVHSSPQPERSPSLDVGSDAQRLAQLHLPRPRIVHPYPQEPISRPTQGRSRMR